MRFVCTFMLRGLEINSHALLLFVISIKLNSSHYHVTIWLLENWLMNLDPKYYLSISVAYECKMHVLHKIL